MNWASYFKVGFLHHHFFNTIPTENNYTRQNSPTTFNHISSHNIKHSLDSYNISVHDNNKHNKRLYNNDKTSNKQVLNHSCNVWGEMKQSRSLHLIKYISYQMSNMSDRVRSRDIYGKLGMLMKKNPCIDEGGSSEPPLCFASLMLS